MLNRTLKDKGGLFVSLIKLTFYLFILFIFTFYLTFFILPSLFPLLLLINIRMEIENNGFDKKDNENND